MTALPLGDDDYFTVYLLIPNGAKKNSVKRYCSDYNRPFLRPRLMHVRGNYV